MSQTTKTVIDIMKNLLLALLLLSPASFADWGDIYYCKETTHSVVTLEGKRIDYILEKFQFTLDETKNAMVFRKLDDAKNAMVFRSSGAFANEQLTLTHGWLRPNQESWYADNEDIVVYFDKGKFLYSRLRSTGMTSVSADCDKF